MIPIDPRLSLNLYTEFFVNEGKTDSTISVSEELAASMIELSIGNELQTIIGDHVSDTKP